MDNKQFDLVCGDLPRITGVSSCLRLDATRLQQFSGLSVTSAYPAAHGGVGSREDSPKHDFDTRYREAASRGEAASREVEKEKHRAAETHEEILVQVPKKTWARKALSNSLLQQKLIAQCGSGVRRLLDLKLCDVHELTTIAYCFHPPSIQLGERHKDFT